MRQPLGGIMEYNLYRLVSNVAVATRLVALLTGICIDVHHGRLSLTGSFLETIIASVYFPFPSDKTKAFESLLTAELLFQPLPRNNTGNKGMLRKIMQSIEESSVDPTVPCLFVPSRYTPYELVSILQSAALSGRGDVAVVLITYFPFIENAIKLPKVFQRLISILSYIQGTSSERIAQKVELVLMFLQNNYHILSRRPDLLFQCVLNSSREALPISTYSEKQIRQLQETKPSEPKKESSSATLSPHMLWVRWVNGEQHGGDSRLSVYKPSQYEITCMAVSEEGDKMAMGCKDFAVRISALHTPEMITATLKHVGVVTAVTFVSQRSNIFGVCLRQFARVCVELG
ncbi:hypothetical protein AGDE_14971 [Angomonas deanei]|uniref:Uncharacterized protein n=1 Tax=Angomonas deanei TaxID=59799 RepID=A0A7G2C8A2_9TRYP|nr:hypothetical protein AGDE_14971 [Angomonas deanei]CAD2215809.1 hypothetical protein, conserved [Angomonas deanei]|eukprot:EPY19907.1 hypothetical protein AGDE_14971 [Angomonas deanei]